MVEGIFSEQHLSACFIEVHTHLRDASGEFCGKALHLAETARLCRRLGRVRMTVPYIQTVPVHVEEVELGLLPGHKAVGCDEHQPRLPVETEELVVPDLSLEVLLGDDPRPQPLVRPFAHGPVIIFLHCLREPAAGGLPVERGLVEADYGTAAVVGALEHETLRQAFPVYLPRGVPDSERGNHMLIPDY